MAQDQKAVIRQVFDKVWNKSDFSLIDRVYGPDYVAHVAGAPRDVEGPEQFKQFVALHGVLASDLSFSVDDQIAEGDSVATRWTATAMPTSGLVSMSTNGEKIKVAGISIHRFADGKIVESWDNWDALTLYQAMGADVFESVALSI
jgi:predicted ester cyclase